jgi:predicted SAM-dependent methyltransferase
MKIKTYLKQKKVTQPLFEVLLLLRGLLFYGNKHQCPCCGWHNRIFIKSGFSLKKRENGYCPRCNSKARHRRNFLFLESNTDFFNDDLRLLHVAPKYCLSRAFIQLPNIQYLAIDLKNSYNIGSLMDISCSAISSNAIDVIVCIHVLEHIENDRQAIRELHRILKPGGWAIISVPIRLTEPTYENPSVVSEIDRLREFGEKDHVRIYGSDFINRLKDGGFEVTLDRGDLLDPHQMRKFGLLEDENIFLVRKSIQ